MTIAGRTLLGIDVGERFNEIARLLEAVMYDFLARFGASLPLPSWLPTPRNLRLKRTITRLDGILQQLIDERRAAGARGAAFLSVLLNARDADDGSRRPDLTIRAEVMTVLRSAQDTIANP